MNLDAAPQLVAQGAVTGSFYALLALSWGIIFATTKIFHFAHALTLTLAAYGAVAAGAAGLSVAGALLVGIAVGAAAGIAAELGLYRVLRRRGALQLNVFLASLGALLAGEAIVQWVGGPQARRLQGFSITTLTFGDVTITTLDLLVVAISWALIAALVVFLRRSRWGLAVQAVASNPELGRAVGIDQARTYLLVFAIGSAMVGAGGVVIAMRDAATPHMGVAPILAAFVAVFVGGIGSVGGAVLGGVLLGFVQNLSGIVLPGRMQVVVTFVLLFAVLLLRPTGIVAREAA